MSHGKVEILYSYSKLKHRLIMLNFEKYEKNPVNRTGAHVQVKKKKQ